MRFLTVTASRLMDRPLNACELRRYKRHGGPPTGPCAKTLVATHRLQRVKRYLHRRTARGDRTIYVCLVYEPGDQFALPAEAPIFRGGILLRQLADRVEFHPAPGVIEVRKYRYPILTDIVHAQ